jgi:uncharacterized membrane protein YdbT with pleckstrin-like domain
MWVGIGVILAWGILYASYYWEISRIVSQQFENLPDALKSRAWDEVVARKGGVMTIILGQHIGVKVAAIIAFVFGVYCFASMMVNKAYTEICVTNERLVLKRGVLSVHSNELNVDRIEGVSVLQGMIGRLLNYGVVVVRGQGIGEVELPTIADPITFRRAIDRAKAVDEDNG